MNTAQPNATSTQTPACPMIEGTPAAACSRGAGRADRGDAGWREPDGPDRVGEPHAGRRRVDCEANGEPFGGSGPDLWCVTEDRMETSSANVAGSTARSRCL
jgi:hypothetical protein